MNKNKKNKINTIIFRVIYVIVFLFSHSIMCIGAIFSDEYKFETLSLSLTGRGTYKDYQEYDILEISGGVDYTSYLKLYNTYFYSTFVNGCRFGIEPSSIETEYDYTILLQNQFTVVQNEFSGDFYYVHDGQYFALFSNEEAVPVTSTRFGCDSFILISDRFADFLVQKYSLSEVSDPYLQLIHNPEYAVLEIYSKTGERFTFCINNIVDSKVRMGERSTSLYDFFGVAYASHSMRDKISYFFDIDLKTGFYSNKNVFSVIKDFLINDNNSFDIEILSYNNTDELYEVNQKLTLNLLDILSAPTINTTPFYFVSVILFIFGFSGFYYYEVKKNKNKLLTNFYLVILFSSAPLLLISIFVDLYSAFNLIPILSFLFGTILFLFSLRDYYKLKKEVIKATKEPYYEINV